MKSLSLLLACLVCVCSADVQASTYEVSVTRKDNNIYSIDGKNILIQTKYCYQYGYGEEAILKFDGYSGSLIFLNSTTKCDVKGLYSKSSQRPGSYQVSVTRESDDWYEIFGQDMYIKTSMCLSLALGTEAFLKIDSFGTGFIVIDNDRCSVEGIYSKIRN